MTWSTTRMQNRILGKVVLLASWFILSLFFTLGLLVIALSIREIIFGFKPGFFPYLYILIALILFHDAYKFLRTIYARNAIDIAKWVKAYFKSNKLLLIASIGITAVLLYIYYNTFFLEFEFVTNIILFLPAFILENLIFIVKVFLKRFIGSSIPEIYEVLIPIAEFYYIHTVIKFLGSLIRNFYYKPGNIKNKN